EGLVARAERLGELMVKELAPLRSDPRVREIRRFGAMVAVEFDAKATAKAAIAGALERDVLLITCGAHDQAVRFIPALNIAEDDPQVAAALRSHLARAGFTVHEARSERDAVRRVEEVAPDVVILDLALENGGGTEACRRIRELPSVGDVPVLVLSAESDVTTKLALFELGADDVVARTCDPTELIARVRAILRRGADRQTVRRIGPLRIALATG